jgi:hypothetical protein
MRAFLRFISGQTTPALQPVFFAVETCMKDIHPETAFMPMTEGYF